MSEIRPIPVDPSHETVRSMIEADQSWLLGAPGDYEAFAVETMSRNGTNWQRLIALRWPARINRTDELVTLRLLVSPEDAVGLSEVLAQTARWLRALATLESTNDE